MQIALHVGQLQQPVPGGIARYVRALLRELPKHDVQAHAFAAGSRPRSIAGDYDDLGWPHGSMRYEAWHRARRPTVRTSGALVHAPSLAIPPVRGRPLVVTAHDVAFHRFPQVTTRRGRAFHERGLALARNHADIVIAPSQFTRGELIDLGIPEHRVRVAYLGTDPAEAVDQQDVERRLRELRVERPFLLTVGTVEPRKRLQHLVTAHQQLRREFPDLELLIVGPPGWGNVGSLEGAGVRRMGALPWPYIDALYRKALLCAISSVYEGFGLPAVEAMNRGCPVVAARGSAVEEVLGSVGRTVKPDDANDLAEALRAFISDDAARSIASAAGIKRAVNFTWSACIAKHVEIYRGLVGDFATLT